MSSNKKICVVTLNIEYDPMSTNPEKWDWNDLVNHTLIDLPKRSFEKYYCPTVLVRVDNYDK